MPEIGTRPGYMTPPMVNNIQGVPLSSTPAVNGQTYALVNGIWVPSSVIPPSFGYSTQSQAYVGPPTYITGTSAPSNGTLLYVPYYNGPSPFTVGSMSCNVTAAGATGSILALAIYADSGAYSPAAQILSAGTISVGTSTGLQSITGLSTVLAANTMYWLAAVTQGSPATAPTYSTVSPIGCQYTSTGTQGNAYQSTGVTGALPNPATALTLTVAGAGFTILLHT
jgi:hypothetical protein